MITPANACDPGTLGFSPCKGGGTATQPLDPDAMMLNGLPLLAGLAFLVTGAGPLSASDPGPSSSAVSSERPVVLVTGSTSGLGREVALRLGAEGWHVIVHGRNEERGMEVVRAIQEEGPGSARFYAADFASLDEVRSLARRVLRDHDRLNALVNNAGIWLRPEEGRRLSQEGHELHFQVNYLAHFLLSQLLLPRMTSTGDARIVNVASVAQRPIDFDDVMLEEGYSDGRAYSQSKLAQILFTVELAERVAGSGVATAALHPATMMDTEMVLARGAEPRASVDEGADALFHLVTASQIENGGYYNGMTPARANDQAYDAEARARLWRLSEELTGLR